MASTTVKEKALPRTRRGSALRTRSVTLRVSVQTHARFDQREFRDPAHALDLVLAP
jgi:hypothetical protein